MGGKGAIEVKKSGSQGGLLPPMVALQEQLAGLIAGPVSCELDKEYLQKVAPLGNQWTYGVSPDRKRTFITHVMPGSRGGADELIIDVWNLETLKVEQQFCSEELATYVHGSRSSDDGMTQNYRHVCFLDNDHIVVSSMTGHLYIFSVAKGIMILKKKVADQVEAITSCLEKDIFAVSIFTRVGFEEHLGACGVKIFSISALLIVQQLKLIEFISYGRGEAPFSILPYVLRFSRSGERLLFRGAAMRFPGYTDYVEVSDLTNTPATTIHERDNKEQVVEASISANHHSALIDCDSISFFDQNQNEISRSPLPENFASESGCRNCLISDDGSRALGWHKGVVYLFAPGEEPRRCFAELGYILDLGWLGDNEVVAFVSYSDSYALCRIDLKSMTVIHNSIEPQKQIIEEIMPRALAVSHDGRLLIGDRQANLRSYDRNLILQQMVKMTSGPINQLVADRFQDRIAVLMSSQELKILSPKDFTLKTYISRSDKTPILAGYGVKSTNYPLMEAGELLFYYNKRSLGVQCDDDRDIRVIRGEKQILVQDGHNDETKTVGKFIFHSPVMAVADCYRQIIFALADGSLMTLNPYDFELEGDGEERSIKPEGDHLKTIAQGLDAPQGLVAAGPGRVVLWTESEVVLLTLADDLTISEKIQISQPGVKNVVYDGVAGRIILVMSHYLLFC
ncbi:MAG: hypothetical protein U9Q39_05050, partial [Pseudomonadota bacterium]|nr:hypothetical protein [Pseudomonadota bacterium]